MRSRAFITIYLRPYLPSAGPTIKSEAYYQARRIIMLSQGVVIICYLFVTLHRALLFYCLIILVNYDWL